MGTDTSSIVSASVNVLRWGGGVCSGKKHSSDEEKHIKLPSNSKLAGAPVQKVVRAGGHGSDADSGKSWSHMKARRDPPTPSMKNDSMLGKGLVIPSGSEKKKGKKKSLRSVVLHLVHSGRDTDSPIASPFAVLDQSSCHGLHLSSGHNICSRGFVRLSGE